MRGFDALQVPTLDQYRQLRGLGFEVAQGYTRVWTQDQVGAAKSIGLAVLPIIEKGQPTSLAYFTDAQGTQDAADFLAWKASVGMPDLFPFLAAIDYDIALGDVPATLPYWNALINGVGGHNAVWAYGPRDAIDYFAAQPWAGIAGFIQAYAPAWSQGRNASPSPYADSIQVPGATIAGVDLDVQVYRSPAALWR